MILLLLASLASAGTNPDRPSVNMSAGLIAADSIELEAGGLWHREGGLASPMRLKYAYQDAFEVRVDANPVGLSTGGPGLVAGTKIPLSRGKAGAFTGFLGSALPIDSSETWFADAMLLYGKGIEDWGVTVNVGVRLDGDGGIGLAGLPAVFAVAGPHPKAFYWFIEAATVLGDAGFSSSVLDGGLLFDLTEQLTLDVGAGYTLDDGAPFAQLGVTANFGKMSK